MTNIKHILFFMLFMTIFSSTPFYLFSQTDTIIERQNYTIIDRYENGKVKNVGQFERICPWSKPSKHGSFITYNEKGKGIKKKIYFNGHRRYQKILGLKFGWWGFYFMNYKYILGIKIRHKIFYGCL